MPVAGWGGVWGRRGATFMSSLHGFPGCLADHGLICDILEYMAVPWCGPAGISCTVISLLQSLICRKNNSLPLVPFLNAAAFCLVQLECHMSSSIY